MVKFNTDVIAVSGGGSAAPGFVFDEASTPNAARLGRFLITSAVGHVVMLVVAIGAASSGLITLGKSPHDSSARNIVTPWEHSTTLNLQLQPMVKPKAVVAPVAVNQAQIERRDVPELLTQPNSPVKIAVAGEASKTTEATVADSPQAVVEAGAEVDPSTAVSPPAQVASNPERHSVFSRFNHISMGAPGEGMQASPADRFDGQRYYQQWQEGERGRQQHGREQQLIAQLAQLAMGQIDAAGLQEDVVCMLKTDEKNAQLRCNADNLVAQMGGQAANAAGLLRAIQNVDGLTIGFAVSYHYGQRRWSMVQATSGQVATVALPTKN